MLYTTMTAEEDLDLGYIEIDYQITEPGYPASWDEPACGTEWEVLQVRWWACDADEDDEPAAMTQDEFLARFSGELSKCEWESMIDAAVEDAAEWHAECAYFAKHG